MNVLGKGIPEDHPDLPEILAEIGDHVPKEALVRGLRYNFEHQVRVAADQGAPTIRKRLYGIARRDGKPIVWPRRRTTRTRARVRMPGGPQPSASTGSCRGAQSSATMLWWRTP